MQSNRTFKSCWKSSSRWVAAQQPSKLIYTYTFTVFVHYPSYTSDSKMCTLANIEDPDETLCTLLHKGGGGGAWAWLWRHFPTAVFPSIKGILKQGHDLIATRSNHLDTHCAMPSWNKMPTYSVSEYLSFSYKWTHNKTLWYKFSDFESNETLWYKFSDFESNSLQLATCNSQLATRNSQLATRNSHFTLSRCVVVNESDIKNPQSKSSNIHRSRYAKNFSVKLLIVSYLSV